MTAASESTTTAVSQHTAADEQQQQSSLSSQLPPIKPLGSSSGLPSLMKMSSMRSYRMPNSMTLPYDASKYPEQQLSEASSMASLLAASRRRSHMNRLKQRLASEMLPSFALARQVSFGTHEQRSSSMDTSNSSTESAVLPSQQHHQHESPSIVEPAPKRRRFQRRNSKTPAMLMQNAADIVAACDFEDEQQTDANATSLDGGLEIAQELVRLLHVRKQRKHEQSSHQVVDGSN